MFHVFVQSDLRLRNYSELELEECACFLDLLAADPIAARGIVCGSALQRIGIRA